jgi:DNA helicase-2/ATP-dependent DNA helicase PcrA
VAPSRIEQSPPPVAAAREALLSGLNDPQREAVTHGGGPLLILAGAGSGKTRVLTHRIAHLVATGAATPSQILAITFTNKAAAEMRERAELLVGRQVRVMWVMTFHAACARMLRAHADKLGYTRQFTIYDQADARRLVKRVLEEQGVDLKRWTPAAIHAQISDAKNRLIDPDAYAQAQGSVFESIVAGAYQAYQSGLLAANAMDFDDLLVRAVDVLSLFDEVRHGYQRQFRHLLVDEYQDTNPVQYRWLSLLAAGADGDRDAERNLTVVGDPAQAIYGFRGADIRNILEFEDDFPDAHVVALEQNYRSTQTILDAANAVIAGNRPAAAGGRSAPATRLWSELGDGDPIKVRELEDEHAEARFVCGEIQALTDGGAARAEIAVFYRTNAQSRVLQEQLGRAEIPYQVIGGTKFYDRMEIKDALAYLTLLVNPLDTGAFTRIVNQPKRGIGATSLARVVSFANTIGLSIWDAALAAADGRLPGLGAAAVKAFARFMDTMVALRARVESGATVQAVLAETLAVTGYLEWLEAERTIEAQGRIENLEELINGAGEAGGESLADYLQRVALIADADGRRDDDGLVTLMTLHNAKGLEYPIVFILGLEDGVFPHSRAMEEGNVEEERRLCYVGITRAQRDLYLTYARQRTIFGAHSYAIPSRFLAEIPAALTDREQQRARRTETAPGSFRERLTRWEAAPGPGWDPRSSHGDRPGGAGVGGWEDGAVSPVVYSLGEDVSHPSFGEGVVTGLEPGGIIVIRFARDASERKLVADLAPITRRSA